MEEQIAFLRLLIVLIILVLATILAMVFLPGIPLLGSLPGDLEVDLPGVSLYLPITTSILLGALLTLIAFFVHRHSQN
ncbi:MAG: DUF2905 domain-containing protein [Bacteroidetes bacterium]|nr:DUF2905 domain-containing protein [Bacteroidota bacterium]